LDFSIHHYSLFNDTATTEIYTLSLHDALPIFSVHLHLHRIGCDKKGAAAIGRGYRPSRQLPPPSLVMNCIRHDLIIGSGRSHMEDRKSTRLNSSHVKISYAVFCLKKKKTKKNK